MTFDVEAFELALKALMVDVDGVIVNHPDPRGWSAALWTGKDRLADRLPR